MSLRRPEKLAHALAREIVSDVAARGLVAGASLGSEPEMMQQYGVSRGPLREAMRILEVLGFLVIKRGPGGGPVLCHVDAEQFTETATFYYHLAGAKYQELAEARLMLEPFTARLAAARRDAGDVAALEQYIAEADRVAGGGESTPATDVDGSPLHKANREFHALIASMSGNRIVSLLVGSCIDVAPFRAKGGVYADAAQVAHTHKEIALAVIRGDGDSAESLMREHLVEYMQRANRRFGELMSETMEW